ncbi:MAG: hypothetical protein ACRD8U_18150 [Pyrinomonadaceae bacterium]
MRVANVDDKLKEALIKWTFNSEHLQIGKAGLSIDYLQVGKGTHASMLESTFLTAGYWLEGSH